MQLLLKRGRDASRVDRRNHLLVQLVRETGGTADVAAVEGVCDGVALRRELVRGRTFDREAGRGRGVAAAPAAARQREQEEKP